MKALHSRLLALLDGQDQRPIGHQDAATRLNAGRQRLVRASNLIRNRKFDSIVRNSNTQSEPKVHDGG